MGQGHSYFFPKIFKNVHFQDNKENGLYFFCHLNIQGNSIFFRLNLKGRDIIAQFTIVTFT